MTSQRWLSLPTARPSLGGLGGVALLATTAVPASVCAATFSTADEVAHRTFRTATAFADVLVSPSPDDAIALAAPGGLPKTAPLRTIEARQGDAVLGRVIVDSVLGKFEQIDYAVAVDGAGKVLGIEILTYREGHGAEVRLPAWRNQFVGKTAADPIKLGADVANISGATLSCTHITDGVRRLVAWAAKHPVAPKAAG
jgi:Na+-transporting NADH:ubiquinone oxidoreductase subunit C